MVYSFQKITLLDQNVRGIFTYNPDGQIRLGDLNFGTILAISRAAAPSVIQIRIQDLLSLNFANLLVNLLRQFQQELVNGALITVEPDKAKIRILPILR